MRAKVRVLCRSVIVGFASLFSFGEADRHFAEPPAIVQPTVEEAPSRSDGEPEPEPADS